MTRGLASLGADDMSTSRTEVDRRVFHTTAGPLLETQVGDVLAHEHMFTELGPVPPVAYLRADPETVYEVIGPWVRDAKALGIGVFVEISPEGIGRRPDIVKLIADRVGLPVMLVTGIYREPFMPDWALEASVEELAAFMRRELDEGVADTGVPAGFIKLSQNATGMTLAERRVLEAACQVAGETGAAIASHITSGPLALSVIDALEAFGRPLDLQRFIWVHAQVSASEGAGLEGGERFGVDPGMDYVLEAARRGAYLSIDDISSGRLGAQANFADRLTLIQRLVDAGYEDRVIIGSDAGWFDPGYPEGFEVAEIDGRMTMVGTAARDYRSIPAGLVPDMREQGVPEGLIAKLMHGNPWSALSR